MSPETDSPSRVYVALATQDVATLVELIKETPTWDTVDEIASTFPLVAQAQPADTLKIATAIDAASRAPDLPAKVSTSPKKRDAAPPRAELQSSIGEMLTSALCVDPARAASAGVAPANAFLVAGLISGACERTGLCRSPEQRGTVCEGLQFPDYAHAPEGAQEVLAVHACLALLVGGAAMYQAIGWEISKLGPALKRVAEENVIKDENGKKVLQVRCAWRNNIFIDFDELRQLAIQQVESEFSKVLDVSEIWGTLFPGV